MFKLLSCRVEVGLLASIRRREAAHVHSGVKVKLRTEAFGEFNVLQCEVLPSSHTIGIILFKLAECGRPIGPVCHARRRARVGVGRPYLIGLEVAGSS